MCREVLEVEARLNQLQEDERERLPDTLSIREAERDPVKR